MHFRLSLYLPGQLGAQADVVVQAPPGTPVSSVLPCLAQAVGLPPHPVHLHDAHGEVGPHSPLGLPPLLDGSELIVSPMRTGAGRGREAALGAVFADAQGHLLIYPEPAGPPAGEAVTVEFPVLPPSLDSGLTPWFIALLPLPAAAAIAYFWHSKVALLVAGVTVVATLALRGYELLSRRRKRRLAEQSHREAEATAHEQATQALQHDLVGTEQANPTPRRLLVRAQRHSPLLWQRDPERLWVRLGTGQAPGQVFVRDGPSGHVHQLGHDRVPIELDLSDGVGLCGPLPATRALATAILGQLAALYSPNDLALEVQVADAAQHPAWEWARWLPHTLPEVAEQAPARLVVLDGSAELQHRASAPNHPGTTLLAIAAHRAQLPATCTTVIELLDAHRALHCGRLVRLEPPPPGWGLQLARALAPLRPGLSAHASPPPKGGTAAGLGDLLEASARLPSRVSWPALEPTAGHPEVLARQWTIEPGCQSVIGVSAAGPVTLHLERDGPHALIAGTTGSGKSELLRTLILGLAHSAPPSELSFVLVDYKGGATFDQLTQLPHVTGVLTDLDAATSARALRSLKAEIAHREATLRAAGCPDLASYHRLRRHSPNAYPPLARLVMVIDEFAALVQELPEFVPSLVRTAAVGRSLGVHLVLATQRPAGVLSAALRANLNLRICLRVPDREDSQDVIDSPAAAQLGVFPPGRAYLRRDPAERPLLFQVASTDASPASAPQVHRLLRTGLGPRLGRPSAPGPAQPSPAQPGPAQPGPAQPGIAQPASAGLDAVIAAHRLSDLGPAPAPPWLPDLPASLPWRQHEGSGLTFAQADLPDTRQQPPVPFNGGQLAVIGAPGSGRSTTLRTLAWTARAHRLDVWHLGPELANDPERCSRLLQHLATTERPTLLTCGPWDQVRSRWASYDNGQLIEDFTRLLGLAPPHLTCVISGGISLVTGPLSRWLDARLILALDPADQHVAGVPRDLVSTVRPPGRGIWCLPGSQPHVLQVMLPPRPGRPSAPRGLVPALPPSTNSPITWSHPNSLTLGLTATLDAVQPAVLRLPAGACAVLVGASQPLAALARGIAAALSAAASPGADHLVLSASDPGAAAQLQQGNPPPYAVILEQAFPVPAALESAVLAYLSAGGRLIACCEPGVLEGSFGPLASGVRTARRAVLLGPAPASSAAGLGVRLPAGVQLPPGLAYLIDGPPRLVRLPHSPSQVPPPSPTPPHEPTPGPAD